MLKNLACRQGLPFGQVVDLADRQWVHPKPQLGLGEILSRRMPLDHAVLSLTNSPLEVLPAGGSVSNPMELLATEDAKTLFSTLRERYRRIIVDTPPIVPFSDADAIGALGDGILMVVRAETTPTSLYQQALGAVTSTRILGTVFNGTVRRGQRVAHCRLDGSVVECSISGLFGFEGLRRTEI